MDSIQAHLADRIREEGMPVSVSPIHRQVWPKAQQFSLERRNQFPVLLVDRPLAAEVVVVLCNRQHALMRNVSAAQHIFEKGNDVIAGFRATERNYQDSVVI